MVDFTEDQIEDIKDGFDLYDRKGSTGTSFVSLVCNRLQILLVDE